MDQTIFYVQGRGGQLFAAKFLYYNDQPVYDPNTANAQGTRIFDATGALLDTQNVNGQLIVPADYDVQYSIDFASSVAAKIAEIQPSPIDEQIVGIGPPLDMMKDGFKAGGSQDLQRSFTGGTFVGAFTDAASFNLGLVSAYSGIPLTMAEVGGGAYNIEQSIVNILHLRAPLDTSGIYGNSSLNGNSIPAGFDFGKTLPGAQINSQAAPQDVTAVGQADDPYRTA